MLKSCLIFIVVCVSLFVNCGHRNTTNSEDASKIPPQYSIRPSKDVDISKYRKDKADYIILFDGKDLNGWRGYGKDHLPAKWKIMDSCLIPKQNNEEGGDIIFGYKFKNFDLQLEWKISKGGNSGIFYLAQEVLTKDPVTEEDKLQAIYISAPEYQILDIANHPDAKLGKDGNRQSGSLYDMIPAKPQVSNPYGEWNISRIVVQNGNVQHYLNDVKVVEYSFTSPRWIEILQSSRFGENKWPLAFELLKDCGGKKHEGYIGFQDWNHEVAFRNIRVKILN